jgi:hypothetical protein
VIVNKICKTETFKIAQTAIDNKYFEKVGLVSLMLGLVNLADQ